MSASARPFRRMSARHGNAVGLLLGAGKQIAGSAAVILAVITLTFLVERVFAPDPTSLFLAPAGNGFVSPAAEAAARSNVRASLGLNHSIPVQYVHFIANLVQGRLGNSFETGRPVTADLLSRLPATAELATYALVFGVVLGVVAGIVSAVRRNGLVDHVVRLFTIGTLALPQFWIGLMLLYLFTQKWKVLPGPIGRLPIGVAPPHSITGFYVIDSALRGDWATCFAAIKQLVLPVLTLGLAIAGPVIRIVRSSMLEALSSDYIRMAVALGFGRRRIEMVYALKNALLPVLTVLASIIAYTLVGSILVEGIFGWPGVGNYAYQAIVHSDFPAIQGIVLYTACLYVGIYGLLEYVYKLVDPRIRA